MYLHLIMAAPALVLLALNLKASFALARAACYERKQKMMQYFLVWLLPVAGAILVWTLAAQSSPTETQQPRQTSPDSYPCYNEHTNWTDNSSGGGWGGN